MNGYKVYLGNIKRVLRGLLMALRAVPDLC
jgi:hypothetical protein